VHVSSNYPGPSLPSLRDAADLSRNLRCPRRGDRRACARARPSRRPCAMLARAAVAEQVLRHTSALGGTPKREIAMSVMINSLGPII
jgi:hypothetical protein